MNTLLERIKAKPPDEMDEMDWQFLRDHDRETWQRKVDPAYAFKCQHGYHPGKTWDPKANPHENRDSLLQARKHFREAPLSGVDVAGYVTVWGAAPHDRKVELEPGCFAEFLKSGADVPLVLDHDMSKILAHKSDGTIFLAEDKTGLYFEARISRNEIGYKVLETLITDKTMACSFNPLVRESELIEGVQLYRRCDLADISLVSPGTAPAIGAARAFYVARKY
jgi:HK97 family phage prohead protease